MFETLFSLVVFSYVDDFFWISPQDVLSQVDASWVRGVGRVVSPELLGWKLDPSKDEHGDTVVLLGLEISLRSQASEWRLNPDKSESWLAELYHVLDQEWLTPAAASKWCGRLSWLNSHIFGRVGRAMLRPLIWRQTQLGGSCR